MIFWLRLDDGKQKPIGVLIRKQYYYYCIPCRDALEPRTSFHRAKQLLLDLGSSGLCLRQKIYLGAEHLAKLKTSLEN